MFNKQNKDIDGLIQGIQAILLENRCSFSDEEKSHLAKAISYLKKFRNVGNKKPIDLNKLISAFEVLCKLFSNKDFTDFF